MSAVAETASAAAPPRRTGGDEEEHWLDHLELDRDGDGAAHDDLPDPFGEEALAGEGHELLDEDVDEEEEF